MPGAVHHEQLLAGVVDHEQLLAGVVHHGLLLAGAVHHKLLLASLVLVHHKLLHVVVGGRIILSLIGSVGFDFTLYRVPKVWTDLLLGHTVPPSRIATLPIEELRPDSTASPIIRIPLSR